MKRHFAPRLARLVALLGLAFAFAGTGAQAATITVNTPVDDTGTDGIFCSIREAVANANDNAQTYPDCAAGSGADRIVFGTPPSGVPITSITLQSSLRLTDSAQTTIEDYSGITLDGGNEVRILIVEAGASAQLNGMILDHGNCRTSGCYGGTGISCADGGNCNGAAIHNKGTLTLTRSTVRGSLSKQWGGGIFNEGTLTLGESLVAGNTAGLGGGLYNTGTLNLINSTVSTNTAIAAGGGLYNAGTATLTDASVEWNTGNNNTGGIYNTGTATLTGTTVAWNTGNNNTGAILNAGALNLTNTTVASNSAPFFGGVQNLSAAAQLTIVGSTLSGNQSFDFYSEINGAKIVGSIVTNMNAPVTAGSYGNLIGNVANVNLGPLQNNGGPTQSMLPGPGSVAIDAVSCADLPTTDQRGIARAQGATCDIGAVEALGDVIFANGFQAVSQCSGVTAARNVWADEFGGGSLSPTLWNANANGGSLAVASGSVTASSSAAQFPFVTAISPIPASGPFSVRWKATYSNVVVNGVGTLVLSNGLPANGANDDYALRRADAWQDSTNGFQVRARTSDAGSYSPVFTTSASATTAHDVEVCWLANTVEIWADGVLRSSSSNANLTRPDSLWFGNPVNRGGAGQPWTSFTLDFVRVNALTTP